MLRSRLPTCEGCSRDDLLSRRIESQRAVTEKLGMELLIDSHRLNA